MHYWQGKELRFSKEAHREIHRHGLSTDDILKVLNMGEDFPGKSRKKGIYEMCLRKGNKVMKVVVAESYSFDTKSLAWVVIHVMAVRA